MSPVIQERIGWSGLITARMWHHPGLTAGCDLCLHYSVCSAHPKTLIDRATARNLITTAGLDFIRDALSDTSLNAGIRYVGWGTGATSPTAGDTTLDVEAGRKAVTSFADGTTGKKTTTVYLGPDDANTTLEELGWFATSTATATVDTGVLVARVLYPGGSTTKDNTKSIQIDRTDTFA
jgi:hypothetical protein